jgi:hypothetical protein
VNFLKAGVVSHREELILTPPGGVTRGFMGPVGSGPNSAGSV